MADIRGILQRCDPDLLEACGESEPDCAGAAGMVNFLTERRRVQKVLWRQLFVLDSMMSLLEGLASAQQLMTQPCPPQPEGGAHSRWKALKAENRSGMEKTETLLRSLQERVQQINTRRHRLTQLVQQLHSKRQQQEQLAVSLLKAQNALRSCDHQLRQLRAESEAALSQLISWQRIRDTLQEHVGAMQELMQIKLISFDQSEVLVEIRPRLSSNSSASELEPLRLSITCRHDDRFILRITNSDQQQQVDEELAGLVGGSSSGRWTELSAALLEVLQYYMGQVGLLCEIRSLRSRFAIDWCPAQRLLVYLKSASLVCHLEVEEGYPSGGRARLCSVRRDGQPIDMSGLKPHKAELSLTEWLVFLCSSPLI
ncbi:hypothetical protein CRENBAI_010462 [Crenichthys baileyi]|uniref:Uncharacterized protein n=1 Tax=Crenichthys baileyi TaxID=28760 RepID=A0AAV9RFS7_9TELE